MITLFLKCLGGGLLVLCGGGIGWTAARQKREIARRISAFEQFLQYVLEAIRFRSLPGAVVLTMAARHKDFSSFCPESITAFSQIRPPDCLDADLGDELREGLCALEAAPHQNVCDTLAHLSELCLRAGSRAQESASRAQKLYPRIGACLGLLAAIVLS